jgi:calmodulin
MTDTRKLAQKQLDEIKSNFAFFDKDKSGQIDLEEFGQLLQVLSPKTTPAQISQGFALVDVDNNGHIDLNEFITWWQDCWWEY